MITTMPETLVSDVMPEIPVIELSQPLPGFPELSRFALVRLDDDGILCSFTSLEEPSLRFLVVPPERFFPDYAPEVDEDQVAGLGTTSVDDLVVLCVLTAGESLADTTANLAAPLVLCTTTNRAVQVVLDDPALSIATPLLG